jgi:hypothetical protein
MNDIAALMGKLGATVAYLQFDEQITEARTYFTVAAEAPVMAEPAAEDFAEFEDCPVSIGVSMKRRYGAPAQAAAAPRSLADIFARLEGVAAH